MCLLFCHICTMDHLISTSEECYPEWNPGYFIGHSVKQQWLQSHVILDCSGYFWIVSRILVMEGSKSSIIPRKGQLSEISHILILSWTVNFARTPPQSYHLGLALYMYYKEAPIYFSNVFFLEFGMTPIWPIYGDLPRSNFFSFVAFNNDWPKYGIYCEFCS